MPLLLWTIFLRFSRHLLSFFERISKEVLKAKADEPYFFFIALNLALQLLAFSLLALKSIVQTRSCRIELSLLLQKKVIEDRAHDGFTV